MFGSSVGPPRCAQGSPVLTQKCSIMGKDRPGAFMGQLQSHWGHLQDMSLVQTPVLSYALWQR